MRPPEAAPVKWRQRAGKNVTGCGESHNHRLARCRLVRWVAALPHEGNLLDHPIDGGYEIICMSRVDEDLHGAPDRRVPWILLTVGIRLVAVCGCLAWLRFEWTRAPDASLLLGPLWFVWYDQESTGFVLIALLAPVLLAVIVRPNLFTASLFSIALWIWTFIGVGGKGIGC